MWGLVAVGVIVVALVCAWLYDRREARRGNAVRSGGAMMGEAVHHHLDVNAVPYEPARHAGQRDWATYRRRDRKPPRTGD